MAGRRNDPNPFVRHSTLTRTLIAVVMLIAYTYYEHRRQAYYRSLYHYTKPATTRSAVAGYSMMELP
jgi:hypothetical protein